MRSICLVLFSGLSLVPAATAQLGENPAPATLASSTASKPSPAATEPMTNDDVIALVGLGLSDDIVIAKIQAAPAALFNTSIGGLRALREGNVSNLVIRFMLDPHTRPMTNTGAYSMPADAARRAAMARSLPLETGDPDDPTWVHTSGVYMLAAGSGGQAHLIQLDHINAKAQKTSGQLLSNLTYGISPSHSRASVDGAHANVQTADRNPTFYAYIPDDRPFFGGNFNTVRDLTLIRFDTKDKTREVRTGTYSSLGSTTGTDAKAKQTFAVEQIKPGIYKLTLNRPLAPGQYAFQQANFGAFYDFGVLPPK